MKIRPSLRIYFFASMVVLSSAMAIGFSFLSVNYFIDGLDKGLNGVMLNLSQTIDVKAGEHKEVVGFNVASRWEDMPSIIKQRFSKPTEIGLLHKRKDQSSMFTLPENLFFVVYYPNPEGEPRYVSRIMLEKDRPTIIANIEPEQRMFWIAVTGFAAIVLFAFFCLWS
ncbi:hypothetical protein ACOBV9_14545 [Pseudoalteromonas espejiana]